MKPVEPVLTVELFPPLSRELLSLLRRLSRSEWERPTACPQWSVKDVAAHLLGGNLGRLGGGSAEASPPEAPALAYTELVNLIDRENAEWVSAARRISPNLLIEFLAITDEQLYQHFKSLPADAPARIPVSWAGESQSPVWFDVAREYTEKWLHQQHIREAVGQPLLTGRLWLFPVFDTFMRALPRTYDAVEAPEGRRVTFHIAGEAGGDWTLTRQSGAWRLFSGASAEAAAQVRLDQDWAWRLFTRGASPAAVRPHLHIDGDAALGAGILNMVSIMG
jgi:uncharacterized protein (TIGR03083 family)